VVDAVAVAAHPAVRSRVVADRPPLYLDEEHTVSRVRDDEIGFAINLRA
jgi:hypothetical protein